MAATVKRPKGGKAAFLEMNFRAVSETPESVGVARIDQ